MVKIITFPHLPQKYFHNIFYTDKKAVSFTVEKELNKLSGHCFQKGSEEPGQHFSYENRWEQWNSADVWDMQVWKKEKSSYSVWTADQLEYMVYLTPISVQLEVNFNLNHLFIHK